MSCSLDSKYPPSIALQQSPIESLIYPSFEEFRLQLIWLRSQGFRVPAWEFSM